MSVEAADLEPAPQEGESRFFETIVAVVDFVVGGVGAATLPFITEIHMENLPTGLQGHYTSHVIWLMVCFVGSVIVRNLLLIPRRVKADIRSLEGEVGRAVYRQKADMLNLENQVGRGFYNGFYALTAGDVREGFELFDKSLTDPNLRGPARELIFGFMARSIAHIGQSGLAMVNAQVSEYVALLNRLLLLPDQTVLATCVVRPYWFVMPEIAAVSLPLRDKAGHLVPFRSYAPPPIRIAVYDERTIGEMLLTAFVDRNIFQIDKDHCPNCTILKFPCPIHSTARADRKYKYKELQLPEIHWFESVVNKSQYGNVDLKYTHVRHTGRNSLSKFEDRVFVESLGGMLPLDVRFSFTNLSAGTLWLKWGDKAQPFERPLPKEDGKAMFTIPSDDPNKPHTIYQNFWSEKDVDNSLLGNAAIDMKALQYYLTDVLPEHIRRNFDDGRKKIGDRKHRLLLPDEIENIVQEAIKDLSNELSRKPILEIYKELVDHYRKNGICEVAYVVSYDRAHPDVPVAAVWWNENWKIVSPGG